MAFAIPDSKLPSRVQQLLDQRQKHTEAVISIDNTLASVQSALGSKSIAPLAAKSPVVRVAAKSPTAKVKKRRKRGIFALSGEESVLAFVKQHKTATTKQVNQHFKAEGRASTADNALSKLTAEKKLKRTPLGNGMAGSSYSLL